MYNFIVCAIFKNESHILNEWIKHYLFHGADHIYLVNDFSTDNYQEIVDRYPEHVTLFHNDIVTKEVGRQPMIANKHFLPLRDKSKWMAVLDLDEFLYSPYEINIPTVLQKYEMFSQLKIDWLHFGSNDHILQPHVVAEGFVKRAALDKTKTYYSYKTIVKTRDVVQFAVHEHTINGPTHHICYDEEAPSELVINHYSIQSDNFFMSVKAIRGDINNWFDHEKLKRDREHFKNYDINHVSDTRLAEQNKSLSLELKQAKLVGTDTVTLVITSCNRPKQLEQTLESFIKYNTYPIQKTYIIDDSGILNCNKSVVEKFRERLNIQEIYNAQNIGQVQSIDKVYSYVTTPYIFHCEEDWEFYKPAFIEKSMAIFKENPDEKLFTVWLRAHNDSAHPVVKDEKGCLMSKDYLYIQDGVRYIWGGITFNPGLRTTATSFLHHPYVYRCEPTKTKTNTYIGEYSVNTTYTRDGYYSRTLSDQGGHVRHIGWDVHIPREWETKGTLLVSSYYKIPSKKSHAFYEEHLRRFFRFLQKPLFFVCNTEIRDLIASFGTDLSKVTFCICEFDNLPILQKFPMEFWKKHKQIDPEEYHTPELGIIWANKKECIKIANKYQPNYTWYLWIDAGCIRKEEWGPSCAEFGLRHSLAPGVYLQALQDIPKEREFFKFDNWIVFIAGAIILVHKDYIDNLVNRHDNMLLTYDAANMCAISDQYVLASLANKESWIHPINFKSQCEAFKRGCVDEWFFFIQYI